MGANVVLIAILGIAIGGIFLKKRKTGEKEENQQEEK
jgi:hypothetical protein